MIDGWCDGGGGRRYLVADDRLVAGAGGDCPGIGFSVGTDGLLPEIGYAADGSAASLADRAELAGLVGLAAERLIFMEQVHGGRAVRVDGSMAGAGVSCRGTSVAGADAMVTCDGAIALVGLSADCPLIGVWSPVGLTGRQVVGLIHAGWRGLAAGVIGAAVELMGLCGGGADELRALAGPSIGPCCYEVGEELQGELRAGGGASADHFVRRGGKLYLDLRGVVRYQLQRAGLVDERIAVGERCTCCDVRLHSYRRKGDAGRQGLVIRGIGASGHIHE